MGSCASGRTPVARLSGPAFGVVAFFCVFGCTVVAHPILAWLMRGASDYAGPPNLRALALFDGITAVAAWIHLSTWAGPKGRSHLALSTLRAAWANACVCFLAACVVSTARTLPAAPADFFAVAGMGLAVLSTFGAMLIIPIGLFYAFGLSPLFHGELSIAATPSRDALRRATWLAARWGVSTSVFAALLCQGGLRPAALALASAIAALYVHAGDVADIRFLDRVERGAMPGCSLRDVKADEACTELLPYHGGDEAEGPYRVLVAREGDIDGPFRSNAIERPIYLVGAFRAIARRSKRAVLVAAASLCVSAVCVAM